MSFTPGQSTPDSGFSMSFGGQDQLSQGNDTNSTEGDAMDMASATTGLQNPNLSNMQFASTGSTAKPSPRVPTAQSLSGPSVPTTLPGNSQSGGSLLQNAASSALVDMVPGAPRAVGDISSAMKGSVGSLASDVLSNIGDL